MVDNCGIFDNYLSDCMLRELVDCNTLLVGICMFYRQDEINNASLTIRPVGVKPNLHGSVFNFASNHKVTIKNLFVSIQPTQPEHEISFCLASILRMIVTDHDTNTHTAVVLNEFMGFTGVRLNLIP